MKQVLTRIQNRLVKYKDAREQRDLQLQQKAEVEKQRKEAYHQARLDFQNVFDKTILRDVREFVANLGDMFREHNLCLKCESHKNHNYFYPLTRPTEPYIVLAIESSKVPMRYRWTECAYLALESDINAGTVKLYSRNDTRDTIARLKGSDQSDGTLLAEYKLTEHDLTHILPHIEAFFDRELKELAK